MKKQGITPAAAILAAAVICGMAGLAPHPAQAADDDTAADLLEVEKVADLYLRSGQTGDVSMLRRAFHESTRLQFVKKSQYVEWAGADYISWRTPGKTSDYEARVLMVDCAGDAAMAKVELDFGSHRFLDYLSLLRIEGRWYVVNKVFHREEGVR
ncbi:MAG: nuclear transport factor 2 family protein [bacterium]|nr:nuclear transport factor 2 family protein [bacterium]